MWQAIALAFGLAMDATAVSAARGVSARRAPEAVILPLVFGGFQSAMSAIGWFAGARLGTYIEAWNRYVAFGLLLLIGGKMLYDALRGGESAEAGAAADSAEVPAKVPVSLYLGLGLATSIDAAAAGITLPMIPVSPWLSVALIGAITAACSLAGFTAGRYLGDKLGARLAALGGLVLIGIGTKILITG